jgi:uncharacterized protein
MPFDSPSPRPPLAAAQVLVRGDAAVESRFMAAVYRWMTLGLAVTALVAYAVAGSEELLSIVIGNRIVFYGLLLGELALVFAISAAATRLSAGAAGALFVLYSALNGATLSVVLLAYTGSSVALAFASTAATFGTMSVYGTVTRRDLSSWGSFLFMGLIGVVVASLANIFLRSSMVSFVVSCASVVVFTGLAAYDTQKLRALARAGGGSGGLAVNGALALYLDFVNLFLGLLRLLGGRRS